MPRYTGFPAEFHVTVREYSMTCVPDGLPALYDEYKRRALVCDEFELDGRELCCITVSREDHGWPFLVVAQSFGPAGAGFEPGVLLVPETQRLFLGAGERILCYDLVTPRRLWTDTADTGFLGWSLHGNTVLLRAELEFAAWMIEGSKLWTTYVEPPWDFRVTGSMVELDVMGDKRSFDLVAGPR